MLKRKPNDSAPQITSLQRSPALLCILDHVMFLQNLSRRFARIMTCRPKHPFCKRVRHFCRKACSCYCYGLGKTHVPQRKPAERHAPG